MAFPGRRGAGPGRTLLWALLAALFFQTALASLPADGAEGGAKDDAGGGGGSENTAVRAPGDADLTLDFLDVNTALIDVPDENRPDEASEQTAMIQFSDDEPIEGQTVLINATVVNVGTGPAMATVYFYDGPPEAGDLIGTDRVEINPLGYQVANASWWTEGEDEFHTIFVNITPDDPGSEVNESNNEADKDIAVNQFPLADAGSDLEVLEDEAVVFSGSGTDTQSDMDAGLVFTWRFNDPHSNASNPDVSKGENLTRPGHAFTKAGTYIVNLTVSDDGGAKAQDSLRVGVSNIPPTAGVSVSKKGADEDEVVAFSGGPSKDTPSDEPLLWYRWDFGDGARSNWTVEPGTEHAFTDEDAYTVALTVRDDDNATDTATVEVMVTNVPPTAYAGVDRSVRVSSLTFDGSGSTDTASDLGALEYEWDFGDGEEASGISVVHNFTEKDTYTVTLTVTDDDGETDSDTMSVTINNLSPVPVVGDRMATVDEDEPITFDANGSYDPDGSIVDLLWDLGDGATSNDEWVRHVYTEAGTYIATLTLTDDEGADAVEEIRVFVENPLPTADAGADRETYEGGTLLFFGGNSTDNPSDLPLLEYLWDFGDNGTGEGAVIEHTFDRAGTYNVTLTVVDDDGGISSHTILVTARRIMLSSINLTADLDTAVCAPGANVTVSGQVNFGFERVLPRPDVNLAPVRVQIVETGEHWTALPAPNGTYALVFPAPQDEGAYTVRVGITRLGLMAEEMMELRVEAPPAPKAERTPAPSGVSPAVIAASSVALVAVVGAGGFTAGTDIGKYAFWTLMIPLYSRLKPSAVLDNFTRGRIYEHVRKNPGENYQSIKRSLDLANGSVTYHLNVLEREEYIKSRTDGMTKRFYPAGMKVEKGQADNIQTLILEKIANRPYISQKELAEDMGLDVSTINYHVNMMAGAGLILSEKKGRTKRYFLSPDYEGVVEVGGET